MTSRPTPNGAASCGWAGDKTARLPQRWGGASHLAASFHCKCTAVGKVQPRDKAGSLLPLLLPVACQGLIRPPDWPDSGSHGSRSMVPTFESQVET